MKAKAILFGPFIGEFYWEYFRFAPHAIYFKKKNPDIRLIVLTRESSFDLYGQYADILLPLIIRDDTPGKRECFNLLSYKQEYYDTLVKYFKVKFKKRFEIVSHKYPDIRVWRYKVKWQFPRNEMNYDFIPRNKNVEICKNVFGSNIAIIDSLEADMANYNNIIKLEDLVKSITNQPNLTNSTTTNGCLIECIKKCNYVIGNINSNVSHLALLIGIPLIHIGEKPDTDYINLLNPKNTPIIVADNIKEGLKIYEDNF